MDTSADIYGSELVTRIFGCWPSFQNAKIHWVRLNIKNTEHGAIPTIELLVHFWEMTNEVSPSGYFIQQKNTLIHFEFCEIDNLHLCDFNQQNTVLHISIVRLSETQLRPRHKIEIKSSSGLGGSFTCRDVNVLSVRACDEEGNPLVEKSA